MLSVEEHFKYMKCSEQIFFKLKSDMQSHKPIPNECCERIKAILYEETMKTNHFHLLWRAISKLCNTSLRG